MKTQSAAQNDGIDQDWELIYFRDVFLKNRSGGLRARTIDRILLLFARYRYNYTFNRRNVSDLFSITENGGSGFIAKCIERGIIRKVKVDEYCFVSDEG